MLAEVILRTSLKPIHPMPQVNLVRIQRKNLLLGECVFDLNREQDFLQLPPKSPFTRKKQVSRQLHGESRSTLCAVLGREVVIGRTDHAEEVHSPMTLEVLVFNGDHRFTQKRGEVAIIDENTTLQGKRSKNASMCIVE